MHGHSWVRRWVWRKSTVTWHERQLNYLFSYWPSYWFCCWSVVTDVTLQLTCTGWEVARRCTIHDSCAASTVLPVVHSSEHSTRLQVCLSTACLDLRDKNGHWPLVTVLCVLFTLYWLLVTIRLKHYNENYSSLWPWQSCPLQVSPSSCRCSLRYLPLALTVHQDKRGMQDTDGCCRWGGSGAALVDVDANALERKVTRVANSTTSQVESVAVVSCNLPVTS